MEELAVRGWPDFPLGRWRRRLFESEEVPEEECVRTPEQCL
jgi:hypothetical protein